jgi:hypothetical protein
VKTSVALTDVQERLGEHAHIPASPEEGLLVLEPVVDGVHDLGHGLLGEADEGAYGRARRQQSAKRRGGAIITEVCSLSTKSQAQVSSPNLLVWFSASSIFSTGPECRWPMLVLVPRPAPQGGSFWERDTERQERGEKGPVNRTSRTHRHE